MSPIILCVDDIKDHDNSLYLNLSHQKHRKIFGLYNETVSRVAKNDTVRENSHVSHNILKTFRLYLSKLLCV